MARIRTIKPEFFHDENLASCTPHARLLAIALLQLCDSKGVFRNIPMQIHAHAFPWEAEVKTPELLGELEGIGYLKTYRVDGKNYGFIPGFTAHQRLSGKEAQSDGFYPGPDKADIELEINYPEDQELADGKGNDEQGKHERFPGKHRDAQEQGTGNREQGKGTGEKDMSNAEALDLVPVEPPKPDTVREIFEHWQRVHGHLQAKLDEKRRKLIRKALSIGYGPDQLKQAIAGCARSPFHMGENDAGRRYDSLDLILRNAEKIDQFISCYENPPRLKGKLSRIEAINEQAVREFLGGSNDPFSGDTIDGEVING